MILVYVIIRKRESFYWFQETRQQKYSIFVLNFGTDKFRRYFTPFQLQLTELPQAAVKVQDVNNAQKRTMDVG